MFEYIHVATRWQEYIWLWSQIGGRMKIFFSEQKRDRWIQEFLSKPENCMVAVASGGFGKHIFTATVMGRMSLPVPCDTCPVKKERNKK